jgi:hypothetical protein
MRPATTGEGLFLRCFILHGGLLYIVVAFSGTAAMMAPLSALYTLRRFGIAPEAPIV